MATVKVKFRPSMVKDRPGTIVYMVIHHRVARQITTEYKIYPHEWDKRKSAVIATVENRPRMIAQKIYWDMKQLDKIVGKLEKSSDGYSSDDVITEFRYAGNAESFFLFMENVIIRLRQLKHTATINNYRAALASFKRFRNQEDIPVEAIDHIVMEDYQAYLHSSGLVSNSISFYMRILRAVYNRAVEQDLTKDRKPFRTVFTGVGKTVKRAISIRDIKRIKELDLSCKPRLEFARDIFIFLFLCRGMSFIDAAFLKKNDVQNGVLIYHRHKTGQLLRVKVIPQIRELIERHSNEESPYLLSVINKSGKEGRKQYESALRRENKALKTIAEILELPDPLTTYVTRHTWATIAKSKNIPVNVISDALGHDSVTTTQIYLASIDSSTIDDANELVVSGLC